MMKRTIRTCFAIAALLSVPIAAQAADLPRPSYKAPIYTAPAFSWTGFYIGINGGYGWGDSQWSGGQNFNIAPKGWMVGGTIGYNLQTGNWVWGLEGDIDWVDLNGTANSAVCSSCLTKSTWLGTARGRIGYAYDRWLPYITGGLAYGNVYMENTSTGGSKSETKAGWTIGGGVEYAFAGGWSTKLEYLYVDLGDATCGSANCGGLTNTQVSFTANLVRAGLNYRF